MGRQPGHHAKFYSYLLVTGQEFAANASAAIATGTLARLKTKQAPNRAEALRQAMLAVMADKRAARFAHPAAWAPFVLVGEASER